MKPVTSALDQIGRCATQAILAGALAVALAQNASASLTHRYSFTNDASDSIGGANGTLMGGVTVSAGAANFSGTAGDYIDLPPGLVSNYTSVTFELWVNVGLNGIWSEIYGFGNQNGGGLGANMLMFCPHSGPGDFRMSYAQADPGFNDEHVVTGQGTLDLLGPVSVTCVYDIPNNAMLLYTNGGLVGLLSPVTPNFSLTNIYNVHSWLGRSLYAGDSPYTGTIDEFRIYNAPLGPLQVAVNSIVGPDTLVTNIVVNSFSFAASSNMSVGGRQNALITFNTANYGSITVSGSTEVTYSSSNPTSVSVNRLGQLLALASGTATISAVYNNQTNSVLVTVAQPPLALAHRYSFTTDASDSIGGANGTLFGSAIISNGAVVLSGLGNSGAPDAYVDLPNNLMTNLTSCTFETWITDMGSGTWARIWDFGNSAGGEDIANGGTRYLFMSLPAGGGNLRGALTSGSGEQLVDWANGGRPPANQPAHIVWAIDALSHTGSLYVNGAAVAINTNMTLTPADIGPTVNDWLGRSQFGGDAMFNGTIDEFRIWNGPISAFQIAINAATGPNQILTNAGALQAVHLTVNTNMVKGGRQSASFSADFASVSNVNVLTLGTTFVSGNTNVVTVNSGGQITAIGIGTTTVTATYGGMSDSKSITVLVKPTVLAHRWSFSETTGTSVNDSVGTAHGTISPLGATLGSGSVTLDGISGFVDLPGHVIDGFDAVTFETWVTVDPATLNNTAARLFEFGSVDNANEVGVTARTSGQNAFIRFFGPPTVTALRGGNLAIGQQWHLVGIFNAPQGTIDLFLNGSYQNNVTNLGFSMATISNAFSRLGANFATNAFTAATFNEFRIYNGALDLYGIRTSMAAGPDTSVMDGGTPTLLTLKADPQMVLGSKQIPHVSASFASVANVNLTETTQISYSSSDTSVITITTDGKLQAVGTGTATVTASFRGKSDSKVVNVFPKQVMLVHRYGFTNDATDSVGAQDGQAVGTATISGGTAVLTGSATERNSYIEFPSGLISSFDAVTFETWLNLDPLLGTWSRIIEMGDQNSGAGGVSYVFLCPHTGGNGTRSVLSDGVTGANEAVLDFPGVPMDGFSGHVALVMDTANNTQSVYTNGVLAGSASLNGKRLSGVRDVHCWLGRSLYSGDAGLAGSIDEFRIYAGALSAAQIAADFTAGPDRVVLPAPRPALLVSQSGSNLVLRWPVSPVYSLQSSLTLGPTASWGPGGSPTVVNGMNQVTVPTTGSAAFYRLIQ